MNNNNAKICPYINSPNQTDSKKNIMSIKPTEYDKDFLNNCKLNQLFCSSATTNKGFVMDIKDFVIIIACLLDDMRYSCNSYLLNTTNITDRFIFENVPNMSMSMYFARWIKYTRPDANAIIIAIIYLDRFNILSDVKIYSKNIHSLFSIAMTLAIKYLDDRVASNKFYAAVGGIPLESFNKFEFLFLSLCSFDLYVSVDEYEKYFYKFQKNIKKFKETISSSGTS
jgi:hypothetical protein